MKDFTTSFYCDFLWINDLLEVKKNSRNKFEAKITKCNKTSVISFTNVTIFGTVVEIKQIEQKKYLYYVDDGTGVIICKHSEDQFEEAISTIEEEQGDILNHSSQCNQSLLDQTSFVNSSIDDSIFNDKTIQDDELKIMKKDMLKGLQSIWNDVYDSFTNLLGQYQIGDTVVVSGKLYTYFGVNQLYVNSIRLLEFDEEIMKISNKLKDGFDPLTKCLLERVNSQVRRRRSGLMTFDNFHHLNVMIPSPRPIAPRRDSFSLPKDNLPEVPPPQTESTITFDTYNSEEYL